MPLTEKDDIEAYLVTFERIMAAHQVEKDCWPQYLAPQLRAGAIGIRCSAGGRLGQLRCN